MERYQIINNNKKVIYSVEGLKVMVVKATSWKSYAAVRWNPILAIAIPYSLAENQLNA